MSQDFLPKASLRSAYDCYKLITEASESSLDGGATHEPEYTTVNYRRCWTIDYIWFVQSLF